jgi:hypothetical protein
MRSSGKQLLLHEVILCQKSSCLRGVQRMQQSGVFLHYLMLSALPTGIRKPKAKQESDDESVLEHKAVKYVLQCSLGLRDSLMHFSVQYESSDEVMCVCSAHASQTTCWTHIALHRLVDDEETKAKVRAASPTKR